MRAVNVKLGETYLVKVSGHIVPVRVDRSAGECADYRGEWRSAGWHGTNLVTGRPVRIKSAARLRCPATV